MWKSILIGVGALALGACATVPQPLSGEYRDVAPSDALGASGTQVRWGGRIVETAPGPGDTCIYALAYPLDRNARPLQRGDSMGRFVACRQGFYDPEVFAKGREITVTGRLEGTVTRKVGEYDYHYPRVAADTVYLWPLPQVRDAYYDSRFYDPFWPRYYDPFWYMPPRVIVVPTKPEPKPGS